MLIAQRRVLFATNTFDPPFNDFGRLLTREGYEVLFCKWHEIVKNAKHSKPSLIIINIPLDRVNEFHLCSMLRSLSSFGELGILLLFPTPQEDLILKWTEAGADNYMVLPVSPSVVVSKINALNKRLTNSIVNPIVIGDLIIDREKYLVTYKNEEINLTLKEFEVLVLLTYKIGKITLRDEIFNLVWGGDVSMRMVDLHIHKIRQKLKDDNIIKTVKGIGYRLQSLVTISYCLLLFYLNLSFCI